MELNGNVSIIVPGFIFKGAFSLSRTAVAISGARKRWREIGLVRSDPRPQLQAVFILARQNRSHPS